MTVTRNILLTGGAGFIGSNMVLYLLEHYPDYRVVILDKMDYCSSIKGIPVDGERCIFIKGDISSADLVNYILKEYSIDTVLHYAANSHVDNSFGNSISFTVNNVLGTHVLLECCKYYGKIQRFIHVSTDEVYGETAYEDNTVEQSVLAPTNPYAASKAAAEHIVVSYWKSFKLPIIIVRCNNVYGPRQYHEKVIPKFILALESDKACTLHGDGSSRRSFIHVDDVVRAFDTVLHKGELGEIYNIATDNEISMKQLAELLVDIYSSENRIDTLSNDYIVHVTDRPFNDVRYHIDGSKLNSLGFSPTISFEDGLKSTIEWYRLYSKDMW